MIIIKNTPRQPKPEDVLKATAVLLSTAVAASLIIVYSKENFHHKAQISTSFKL